MGQMLRGFFEGIFAAIGFAVGIIVLMMILLGTGQKLLTNSIDESFRTSFNQPATAIRIDRSEKFQDCVLNNWGNDANVSDAEIRGDAKFASWSFEWIARTQDPGTRPGRECIQLFTAGRMQTHIGSGWPPQ